MDLSGRTNIDLAEAARLMKQPTSSPTVNNPGQMQPPPLMMMQQAVAMQQFQFQQALLMQQVMATQQAAARAATVKSAAEMAAARAAEISKQLKGSDDEEEKKPVPPSPRRSKSRSLSRSRSVTKSKSRSPIRYRRGRSPSRSPIRYRRDRAYSPSRSRDYYSYRSRSRRGYFRGRGDHYWSPFRRDWDRDRDRDRDRDYYPRHRRSRSRSRSRGRRRSRTRSRSPRYRRERTPSPRIRREERRSMRGSRRSRSRSVSRETKRSISSRSPSASPRRIENSSSPVKKVHESGSDIIHRDDSKSPVRRIVRRDAGDISVSPGQANQIGSPEREEPERSLQNDDSFETKSDRDSELPRKAASISPPRSLSVSLDHSLSKDLESDDEELDSNSKGNKGSTGPLRVEYSDDGEADHPRTRSISPEDVKPKVSSSDVSSDEVKDGSERNGQFAGRPTRNVKMEERSVKGPKVVTDEDSDEDKGLDDWRDDVKSFSSERIGRREGKQKHDRQAEGRKPIGRESRSSFELGRVRPAQSDTGKDRRKYVSGADVKQSDYDAIQERQHPIDSGRKDLRRQESFRYRGRSPLAEIGKGSDLRDIGKRKEGSGEEAEELSRYPSKKGGAQIVEEETEKQEPSFKAYTVSAGDVDTLEEAVRPALVEDYKDEEESDGGIVVAPRAKAKEESDLDDEVKATLRRSDYDEEDEHTRRKDKEKRSRDRRLDDQEDRKKRKERHKRHRKKHRRDDEDDKDEDDDDGEGRKERRRHRRRHRREDDDSRRDRKKRKHRSHRSRGKSASDSAGDSPRAEADATRDEKDESPIRKRTSSRHKKRKREPSKSPVISDSSSD